MKKTVKDINLAGSRVFWRVDYNVPMENGYIQDTYKIQASLSSLEYIINQKPKKLIIGSHLGRPKGNIVNSLTLKPVYEYLKEIFETRYGKELSFCTMDELNDKNFVLLENLRFYPDEECPEGYMFADFFQKNVDCVVVDAFGVLHRRCGSILNTRRPTVAGLLTHKEISVFEKIMNSRIDLMIFGGAKVEDKLRILNTLIAKTKKVFLVGGLGNVYAKYLMNRNNGGTISYKETCAVEKLITDAKNMNVEILSPVDFMVMGKDGYSNALGEADIGVDIGPVTIELLVKEITQANFILWNGPPGVFERESSQRDTKELVEILAKVKNRGGYCVVGGGETGSSIRKYSSHEKFSHVSTGGGAFMQLISRQEMPGIMAIEDK